VKQVPIRGVLFSLMVMFALILSACPGDGTPTPAVAEPEGVLVVPETTPAPEVAEPTPAVEPEVAPEETPVVDPAVEATPEVTPDAEVVTEPQMAEIGVVGAEGAMMLGSELLGQDILNAEGDNFGNIEDLLVNADDGHILYALVQYGGILTIGADVVPVPLQALQWVPEQEAFFLNMDEQQLETLPDIGDQDVEAMFPQWDAQVAEFWRTQGVDVYWHRQQQQMDPATGQQQQQQQVPATGQQEQAQQTPVAGQQEQAQQTPVAGQEQQQQQTPVAGQEQQQQQVGAQQITHVMRASTLTDQNLGGQWADRGTIDDFVVDLSESRVRYMLVEIDDQYTAIPFAAFTVTVFDGQTVLEPTPQVVDAETVPVINRDFFGETRVLQRGWDDDLDAHWREQGIDTASPHMRTPAVAPEARTTPQQHVGVAGAQDDLMILASRLLGQDVESADQENIGSIDDFIMDVNTGNVLFALVRHGGFLGIGSETVPVPLQALSVAPDFDNLVLNVTEAEFETWPNIEIDNTWPAGMGTGWEQQVGGFWETAGYDVGAIHDVAPGAAVRGSHLVGFGVGAPAGAGAAPGTGVGAVGTPAATTNDLIVDLQDGQVKYAILSFTDVAVWGDQWIIVPFEAFDPAAFGDQFIFQQTVDPEVIAAAPRVDAVALTDAEFLSPRWDDELQAYWQEQGFQFNQQQQQ
jgi:sporulation protein YlmC with PRC-barrel domain